MIPDFSHSHVLPPFMGDGPAASSLEQKFLQASLAQAQVLLADASEDDDPIGQHQFRQLVHELEGKLAVMPQAIAKKSPESADFVAYFGP